MAVLLCALYHQREYKSDGLGVLDFVEKSSGAISGSQGVGLSGIAVSRIPMRYWTEIGLVTHTRCSLQALH